jgi:hypothetical protein
MERSQAFLVSMLLTAWRTWVRHLEEFSGPFPLTTEHEFTFHWCSQPWTTWFSTLKVDALLSQPLLREASLCIACALRVSSQPRLLRTDHPHKLFWVFLKRLASSILLFIQSIIYLYLFGLINIYFKLWAMSRYYIIDFVAPVVPAFGHGRPVQWAPPCLWYASILLDSLSASGLWHHKTSQCSFSILFVPAWEYQMHTLKASKKIQLFLCWKKNVNDTLTSLWWLKRSWEHFILCFKALLWYGWFESFLFLIIYWSSCTLSGPHLGFVA